MVKKSDLATPENLLEATRMGNLLLVHKILKRAPDLAAAALDEKGNTALHVATELANENAVTVLLAHKCDRLQTNEEGKSAVEIAYDADNKPLLTLLTEADELNKRAKVVFTMLSKAQEEENARKAKMSRTDYLLAFINITIWLIIFFATFCCLFPDTAKKVIGADNYDYLARESVAFLDKVFRSKGSEEYDPQVDLDSFRGAPEVVKQAIASGEMERRARKAAREAAASMGGAGAAGLAGRGPARPSPYGALHGEEL